MVGGPGCYPDFIGIGAQRAATTWVHECLREHPEVFVPAIKEVHYFDEHFARGPAWYTGHFRPRPGQRVKGEITPNYLDVEAALPRLAQTLPNTRLFVILREPVERALSAYHFFPERFAGLTFAEACRASGHLVNPGRYARHLERFFVHYGKEQLKVILYDDIEADPAHVLADLFGFLGIDDAFVPPSVHTVYNSARFPYAQEKTLKRLGFGWAAQAIKSTAPGRWLKTALGKGYTRRRMVRHREFLRELHGAYRDDILRLQVLIGRDLSGWMIPRTPKASLSGSRVLK
jgi:hypothetical protein